MGMIIAQEAVAPLYQLLLDLKSLEKLLISPSGHRLVKTLTVQ